MRGLGRCRCGVKMAFAVLSSSMLKGVGDRQTDLGSRSGIFHKHLSQFRKKHVET